jgi:hypothetical protein
MRGRCEAASIDQTTLHKVLCKSHLIDFNAVAPQPIEVQLSLPRANRNRRVSLKFASLSRWFGGEHGIIFFCSAHVM